jgi:hypothetical protein
MSGYLKRMVSGARNPVGSIHPVVGSLFSEPKQEVAPLAIEEDISISSRTENLSPRTAREQRFPVSEAPELNQDSKRSHSPTHDDVDSPPKRTLMPTMPQAIEEPAVRSTEMPGEMAPLIEQFEASGNKQPIQPSEHLETRRHDVILRVPYQPLLDENVHHTSGEANPHDLGLRAPQATRKDQKDFPRRNATERLEQDEIQIHIGRIEVTALPRTVARPAAPPTRKSLNLDEYLKRGRGRA